MKSVASIESHRYQRNIVGCSFKDVATKVIRFVVNRRTLLPLKVVATMGGWVGTKAVMFVNY